MRGRLIEGIEDLEARDAGSRQSTSCWLDMPTAGGGSVMNERCWRVE